MHIPVVNITVRPQVKDHLSNMTTFKIILTSSLRYICTTSDQLLGDQYHLHKKRNEREMFIDNHHWLILSPVTVCDVCTYIITHWCSYSSALVTHSH